MDRVLVALCDARDSHHRTAVAQLGHLADTDLGTCEAVLVESCFHLPHRAQRNRLRVLLDRLHIAAVPDRTDHAFWIEVLDWLSKYADHDPDWADGCLAVLCGRDETLRVCTYDAEFRTTWRCPDGRRIPLAVKT